MEFNKDEATRSESIAENKLTEGDIAGAKRFATDSQCFPTLLFRRNLTLTRNHHHTPASSYQPIPSPPRPETFWTPCNICRTKYEYLKIYLNQNLICPNCRLPFFATEKPAPPSGKIPSSPFPWFVQHQTAPRIQPADESLKRQHEEAVAMAGSEDALQKNSTTRHKTYSSSASEKAMKKRLIDRQKSKSGIDRNQITVGSRAAGHTISSGNLKGYLENERVISASNESQSTKVLSRSEIRTLLMGRAKIEIVQKLNEWNIGAELKSAHKKGVNMEMEKPLVSINAMPKAAVNDLKINKNKCDIGSSKTSQPQKSSMGGVTGELNVRVEETVLMSMPDADFHNFDEDRIEECFSENQVWALYDDDDGMPRYYALIRDVMSRKPFKVGQFAVNKSLSSFSHQVNWTKGTRGSIQIFPAKGEVWALYRNWSPDLIELSIDDVLHKYDVALILEDYNEERGVIVSHLVKVAGFTSVFHQPADPIESRTIPRQEMFRLSDQVPSYMLTGHEARNIPKDCWELDPAALPLELLQNTTYSKEADVVNEEMDGTSSPKGC
ncbi:DNAJ heat shock N-terminal domain-containing protein [Abeliophyllum distichum]|uniref:DNAJ heat shock N-terminal domain-containing protein n=1 Tax=Abeliophyllum distichum TaxID=126358 RepID=A0ABD1PSE7_9LAMI